MTKFLGTVCKTVGVVLSTIFLPVRILIGIIWETGIILFVKFIKKVDIGFKEGCIILYEGFKYELKKYRNTVVKLYEED